MSYRFNPGESVRHGVRRIVRRQLDDMIVQLRAGPERRNAVHEARKHSKKLRAAIRLARDEIGDGRYRSANTRVRDLIRPLGPIRDAEAMTHSLTALEERFAGDVRGRAFGALRRALQARARAARKAPEARAAMRAAAAEARRLRAEVARWPIQHRGWRALDGSVRRIYARARTARPDGNGAGATQLHEWRKRSKDVRYLLELLEPVWPPVMDPFIEEIHALTDRLGDDHDLAELASLVESEPDACGTPEDCTTVLGLIDVRRGQLQAEARRLGERLYGEKAQAFVRRLARYWKTWRKDGTRNQLRGASLGG